ncbi:uncharacterized protein LOC121874052 isoform X2 [Homarus americanus]|uniref:uncharacterized protein LOC121874052 isoform X2 n=1 Tax=Homarus americanus TaxID=6706 RepID=UPI001C482926|nr:uncharacterized protein LOC121874052 isoform X2 [Homarus americanus]
MRQWNSHLIEAPRQVIMMPGETPGYPQAGGAQPHRPAPDQMNGCATIPFHPVVPGGPGGCGVPGSLHSRTDNEIMKHNCMASVHPPSHEPDFVSENFCVYGIEDRGLRSSECSLGIGGSRFSLETRTVSTASSTSVNGEWRTSVGERDTSLGEERQTHVKKGATSVQRQQRVSGISEGGAPPGRTFNTAAKMNSSPYVESSSDGEISSPEGTWSSLPDNTYLPHYEGEDPYMGDALYQEEPNCTEIDPFIFTLDKSEFNIRNSEVHIGPKTVYEMSPTPLSKSSPADPGDHHWKEASQGSSGMLHINLNASPAHPMTAELRSHSPLLQTVSAPDKSSTSPVTPTRPGPSRFTQQPVFNIPLVPSTNLGRNPLSPQTPIGRGPQVRNPMEVPVTPPGNISITGDTRLVVGTQIVINHPGYDNPRQTPNSDLENLLTEVRDKLSTVYSRQTKTSFLPWLKGHQVIPMREFYTESRILAVDKQGKQTRQSVNLVYDLVHEKEETRFLVEGEPGMGKTLLALKLAIDWANKKNLQEFKFVFLIFLRDFKGSLEQYVKEELLPSHFEEKFKKVWEYCKMHEEQVLFILDGYDELEKADEGEIQKLLGNRDFQNSKVVVTARPDVLKTIAQRTIVKGFNEAQMFEFITKYFKLVNEDECGRNLKKIIEKDYKYRKLAKRPLFCVLLCMLYGSDGVAKLPEKLSDLMFKIMLCLIKWNIKKVGNVDENTESFPPEYEELFLSFGKLCLEALKTEKTRFSAKQIQDIENSDKLLHLGFLSNDSENGVLGHKKFWKPVHKIFLEYLAGLYIANHIERYRSNCRECREFSKVYRHEHVLKFVVGILGKRAHLALVGKKRQAFLQMRDQELLMLLREAEPTYENCRAVAKLLDRRNAIVHTSEMDFEGWSFIIAQNFKKLKSLEIVWRIKSNNPDQESSFNEATPDQYTAFFNALKSNTSINKISIRATQDGEPFSDQKIELFFSHLQAILPKVNLRELEIKELKMSVSHHLRKAFEGATCHMDKKALEDLQILRLDMYMSDDDLEVLCRRLTRCAPKLKELQLTGLVHGPSGFDSLVELLKKNRNLHKLCLSMSKAQLMPGEGVFMGKMDLTPAEFRKDIKQMTRKATRESKDAFKKQGPGLPASTQPPPWLTRPESSSTCSRTTSTLAPATP